jgi:hypothetical protein
MDRVAIKIVTAAPGARPSNLLQTTETTSHADIAVTWLGLWRTTLAV